MSFFFNEQAFFSKRRTRTKEASSSEKCEEATATKVFVARSTFDDDTEEEEEDKDDEKTSARCVDDLVLGRRGWEGVLFKRGRERGDRFPSVRGADSRLFVGKLCFVLLFFFDDYDRR